MRFVDASVFVHAYLKLKREPEPHEKEIKEGARKIIQRIEEGEEVSTSVVHLSETANILEDFFPLEKALSLESSILTKDNIRVMNVSRKDYLNAMGRALEEEKGLNDLLAYVLMKKENQSEIYSFDKEFDEIEGIERINE